MESPQYDVFLSYASGDAEWVSKLNEDLKKRGIKTFFAPRDIEPGTKVPPSLVEAIENSRTFAVIVSPESMKSAWVEDECGLAQSRANARKDPKRIIPILYESAPLRDFLGERQAIDFTHPADYQDSLDKLIFVIRPQHLAAGRPGDGVWVEYPHRELRGYSEDFGRILRYLLDEQHPDGNWFHGGRWSYVATAQITELLARVQVEIRRLLPGEERYSLLFRPSILRAVRWLLGQLAANDDFWEIGDDLWDRGFIARSLLYVSTNRIIQQPTLEELRGGSEFYPFQSFVQHLIAEFTLQPWVPSAEGGWSGAGFLGPLLLVAAWMEVKTEHGAPWTESIVAQLRMHLNDETATLGATDPMYYPWHAGNVVDAMQEAGILIEERPRREVLQKLVTTLPQSREEVIWAVGAPQRERSLIANWGAIALLVLYGPHHRNVRATLNYFQRRFFVAGSIGSTMPRLRFVTATLCIHSCAVIRQNRRY